MINQLENIQHIMIIFIKTNILSRTAKLKQLMKLVNYVIKMENNNLSKQYVVIKYVYNALFNQYKLVILNVVKYAEEKTGTKKYKIHRYKMIKN